jgi:hypothetical protein
VATQQNGRSAQGPGGRQNNTVSIPADADTAIQRAARGPTIPCPACQGSGKIAAGLDLGRDAQDAGPSPLPSTPAGYGLAVRAEELEPAAVRLIHDLLGQAAPATWQRRAAQLDACRPRAGDRPDADQWRERLRDQRLQHEAALCRVHAAVLAGGNVLDCDDQDVDLVLSGRTHV